MRVRRQIPQGERIVDPGIDINDQRCTFGQRQLLVSGLTCVFRTVFLLWFMRLVVFLSVRCGLLVGCDS